MRKLKISGSMAMALKLQPILVSHSCVELGRRRWFASAQPDFCCLPPPRAQDAAAPKAKL